MKSSGSLQKKNVVVVKIPKFFCLIVKTINYFLFYLFLLLFLGFCKRLIHIRIYTKITIQSKITTLQFM